MDNRDNKDNVSSHDDWSWHVSYNHDTTGTHVINSDGMIFFWKTYVIVSTISLSYPHDIHNNTRIKPDCVIQSLCCARVVNMVSHVCVRVRSVGILDGLEKGREVRYRNRNVANDLDQIRYHINNTSCDMM